MNTYVPSTQQPPQHQGIEAQEGPQQDLEEEIEAILEDVLHALTTGMSACDSCRNN
jgi:hypothetical protein